MNNDLNRNTRTLIASFVIAIMFLIPLRFVEVGNSYSLMMSNASVLGESIVLPVAPEVKTPLLEAPYNREGESVLGATTENEVESSCVTKEEASNQLDQLTKLLEVVKDNDLQTRQVVDQILEVQKNICK